MKAVNQTVNLYLAARMRQLRLARGLDTEAMAALVGMSRPVYERLERGARRIGAADLIRVAMGLQGSVDETWGLRDLRQAPGKPTDHGLVALAAGGLTRLARLQVGPKEIVDSVAAAWQIPAARLCETPAVRASDREAQEACALLGGEFEVADAELARLMRCTERSVARRRSVARTKAAEGKPDPRTEAARGVLADRLAGEAREDAKAGQGRVCLALAADWEGRRGAAALARDRESAYGVLSGLLEDLWDELRRGRMPLARAERRRMWLEGGGACAVQEAGYGTKVRLAAEEL